jgi:hypothetical protein
MIYWKAGGHPSSVGMAVSFSVAETGSARSSSIEWNGSNIFSVKRQSATGRPIGQRRPTSDEYQGKSHQVDLRKAAVVDIPAGQLDLALSQQSPSRSISFAAMRAKGRRGG